MEKNRFLKILCYGTYVVGFQTMVIMDLLGMAFHAVVVIAPFLAILFIWTSAYCDHTDTPAVYRVFCIGLLYFESLDFQQELSFGLKIGHVYVH